MLALWRTLYRCHFPSCCSLCSCNTSACRWAHVMCNEERLLTLHAVKTTASLYLSSKIRWNLRWLDLDLLITWNTKYAFVKYKIYNINSIFGIKRILIQNIALKRYNHFQNYAQFSNTCIQFICRNHVLCSVWDVVIWNQLKILINLILYIVMLNHHFKIISNCRSAHVTRRQYVRHGNVV